MAAPGREVQYARLLKPYPTKRLADGLYQLLATAHTLEHVLIEILIDPPATPEPWCQALQRLSGEAAVLEDCCRDAQAVIGELYDRADEQYEVAVAAMMSALKGMREA